LGILPPEQEFEATAHFVVLLGATLLLVLDPLGVLVSAAVHCVDTTLVDALLSEVLDHLLSGRCHLGIRGTCAYC
jgi:hypothetical protein